jgi:hypothetical protein
MEKIMDMEHKWLSLLHDASEDVEDDAARLSNITDVLYRVGMDRLADEIYDIKCNLTRTSKNIREATSLKTTEDCNNAFAASSTILNTLLVASQKKSKTVKEH